MLISGRFLSWSLAGGNLGMSDCLVPGITCPGCRMLGTDMMGGTWSTGGAGPGFLGIEGKLSFKGLGGASLVFAKVSEL